MNRAMTRNQKVLIEVLWHRKAQEERKAKDELCSEAIQVAELDKSQTSRSCLPQINTTVRSRFKRFPGREVGSKTKEHI